MISFACKEIDIRDLIKCSFSLNKTDYKVFEYLMKQDHELTVDDLAKKLRLERSGVQKAIRNLVSRELVLRRQKNLDRGGYQFAYSIKDKDEIKRRIEHIIDGWHRKVREEIAKWS